MEILTDPPTKPGRPRRARTATKTVSALRHVHFEDLGVFAPIFLETGYEVSVYDAGIDDLRAVEAEDPDILVVLGGPIGANDETDFPFLEDERRIIENRLSGNRPTLGVCLGAQLIARAAGGKVFPGRVKEVGWSELTLSADRTSPRLFATCAGRCYIGTATPLICRPTRRSWLQPPRTPTRRSRWARMCSGFSSMPKLIATRLNVG